MKAFFRVKLQRIVITSHFRFMVNRVVPLVFWYSPTITGGGARTCFNWRKTERLAGGVLARSGRRHVDVKVIPQMATDVTHIRNRSGDLIGESMLQGYVVSIVVTMRIGSSPNEVFTTARGALKCNLALCR